jgi:hypothetical protein
MNNRMEENELLRRIADLPREIQPRNDPWTAISARLETRGTPRSAPARARSRGLWAAAATVVLALVGGILVGPRLAGQLGPGAVTPITVTQPGVNQPGYRLPATLAASEAEYGAAFREFIPVGQARSSLSAQTVATIETGWADLREVESALAAALALNPDDRFLNRRMQELRARQLGFLQQLASLDQSNRRLTI